MRPLCTAATLLAQRFDEVAARRDVANAALHDAPALQDRVHIHRVADNQAVEAEFAAQQVGEDAGGECTGKVGIEVGEDDVRGHDRREAVGDGGLEGDQFDRAQAGEVVRDAGDGVVGVDPGVAVAGEVLGAGGDTAFAQSGGGGEAEAGDFVGALAVGAGADDGVARVVVHVEDRGEVHVDAERAEFARGGEAPAAGVVGGAGRADRHRRGEGGRGWFEARDAPALLVGGDDRGEAGSAGEVLQAGGEGAGLLGGADVAREEDRAAEVAVADDGLFVGGDGDTRPEAHGDQLADLLFER
jgi:hypothetical protein